MDSNNVLGIAWSPCNGGFVPNIPRTEEGPMQYHCINHIAVRPLPIVSVCYEVDTIRDRPAVFVASADAVSSAIYEQSTTGLVQAVVAVDTTRSYQW